LLLERSRLFRALASFSFHCSEFLFRQNRFGRGRLQLLIQGLKISLRGGELLLEAGGLLLEFLSLFFTRFELFLVGPPAGSPAAAWRSRACGTID
jgi:hypothetical protein